MRTLACLLVALVASCDDSAGAALTVTVRTDWVPGVEFGGVLVELDAPGVEPTTRPAFVFEDYAAGVRVAELSGLPAGTHHLVVALLSPGSGVRLDEASVRVDLRENDALEVTVLITREVRACDGASDCTSAVACVEGSCVDGNCLFAPHNDRCAPTEYCDPEDGCLLRDVDGGAGLDAGVSDAGSPVPDGGVCAGPTFVWRRAPEWTLGASAGSTAGNPSPDAIGRAAWFYEATTGGRLGATDVWYSEAPTLLVWDESWFGDVGGWASSDDVSPVIDEDELTHVATPGYFERVPRVRWHNPTGRSLVLRISGRLRVWWGGSAGAAPMEVDLAIVRLDGAGAEVLFEMVVEKPTPDTSYEDVTLDVWPIETRVGREDSVVVSLRAEREWDQTWMILVDDLTYLGTECD